MRTELVCTSNKIWFELVKVGRRDGRKYFNSNRICTEDFSFSMPNK